MNPQSKYLKNFTRQVKDYFTFTKGESIGFFILISIITIVSLFYFFQPYFINQKAYDFTMFDREVREFLKTQEIISEKTRYYLEKEDNKYSKDKKSYRDHKLNPFPFDPNTLTHDQWVKIGLTDKQIKVIENYRAKGGKYYDKEDFKKMYCISQTDYEILEPYIEIKMVKPEYPKNNTASKDII